MIVLPLLLAVVLGVGILVSPIFALIIFVIGFAGYLGLAMMSRGKPEEMSGAGPAERSAIRGRQEEKETRIR